MTPDPATARAPWLALAGVSLLPKAASDQGAEGWCVLDTAFGQGLAFLRTWNGWRQAAGSPGLLHYVALCPAAPDREELLSAGGDHPELMALAQALANDWFGLLPGFHRFLLDAGRVSLTLCVGDALQALRQQRFQADVLLVDLGAVTPAAAPPGAFDATSLWAFKALVRCCRRGTLLQVDGAAGAALEACRSHARQCGFANMDPQAVCPTALSAGNPLDLQARFDPPWALKNTRQTQPGALPVQRCAVIGAGLAGASVAAALARRGWQVRVLDAADAPASGASSLPVGLVVPHTSSDDCPLSRLSRAGVRLMLQQARQHLQTGKHWSATGVLERQVSGTPQLPADWPAQGQDWSAPGSLSPTAPDHRELPGLWHPRAAWIKPAELVRAWLSQPGIVFQGNAQVSQLRQEAGVWQLLDADGQLLCCAERVVFANACGARPLLEVLAPQLPALAANLKRLPTTHGMRGLLSWALHGESAADLAAEPAFPTFPVNGYSSLIAGIPTDAGSAWFMGSSYQPQAQPERCDADNHASNLAHLQQLLPALAGQLAPTFASAAIRHWKGTRCISADRLPQVGPLDDDTNPSLWLCTALGSRGLSFSVLCAELLAARMGAEPLPVEANLAKALEALRA